MPAVRCTRIAAALLLAAACVLAQPSRSQQSDDERRPLSAPLTFTNGAGQRITTADFSGKWLLVYFGYMHCADLCPLGLSVLSEAVEELGSTPLLQPVFITIDPERDNGAPLTAFARSFHRDMIGLTGTADEIAKAAAAMGVRYSKVSRGNDYSMDHSSSYSLIGPDRRTVLTFKQAEPHLVAARIVAELDKAGADLSAIANIGAFR